MRRAQLYLMAGAVLLSARAIGAIQDPMLGSLIPRKASAPSDGFDAARAMAACVVTKDQAHVRAFVDARGSAQISAASHSLAELMSICIEGNSSLLRANQHELQAVFSEAVVRRYPDPELAALPKPDVGTADWMSDEEGRRDLEQVAVCVADTHPESAQAFVMSDPASRSEEEALAGLSPLLKPCVPKGKGLQTDRHGLRLVVAAALYHRMFDRDARAAGNLVQPGKN